ncbi:MAG: RES family NAD+ phosphorylase [Weeksellaceae bacterium]
MLVYRVSKTQYAEDLEGTGAKLYGSRWNRVGTPCIYTSESRALAILEYSVNSNIDFIPRALSLCTFEIDESVIKQFRISQLPGDWKDAPVPYSTKRFGTKWFEKNMAILKVPSIVIPEEFNYLINPVLESNHFKLLDIKDLVYDLRIKKN